MRDRIHIFTFIFAILFVPAIGTAASPLNISITFPIGSIHDTLPGEAHLIEHLKFKTTSAHDSGIYENIPGATFNASTETYKTTYLFQVGVDALPAILKEFRNISLPLDITQADFEREKKIVKQEILQRTKSNPDIKYYQQLNRQLYAGTHFAHWPVGQLAAMDALTLDDVKQWNKNTYQNARALVTISGELDKGAVQDITDKILYDEKYTILVIDTANPPKEPDHKLFDQPALFNDPGITINPAKPFTINAKSDRVTTIKFNWRRIYKARKNWRDRLAIRSLLVKAVGSHLHEGLNDLIAEENRIVRNWNLSISWPVHGYWQLNFSATLAEGVGVKQVKNRVSQYLENLATKGISKKSFKRLKKRMIRDNNRQWEFPDQAVGSFRDDVFFQGRKFVWDWPKKLIALQPGDARNFLQDLNSPIRNATLIIKPKEISNDE